MQLRVGEELGIGLKYGNSFTVELISELLYIIKGDFGIFIYTTRRFYHQIERRESILDVLG